MAEPNFAELFLTCGSWQEAQNIVDELLDKGLIACAELFDIKSKFAWKGRLNETKEVKLIMLSSLEKFSEIEKVVAKHHGYETFVLQATPVEKINSNAKAWWARSLR